MADVFVSYSHRDREHCDTLLDHLGWSRNSGAITVFEDKQLKAGEKWDERLKAELAQARIVICLVSRYFTGSTYCTVTEMMDALASDALVIPVILRPVDFAALPLSERGALPKDKNNNLKPIMAWRGEVGRDTAWAQVARAIREAVEGSRGGGTPSPGSGNPPPVTADRYFKGREGELGKLEAWLLDESRPVTIGGVGGIGKTALAHEFLRRFGKRFNNWVFVDLLGYAERPALSKVEAMTAVLSTLGIKDRPPDEEALARLYRDTLARKKLLLVFDNARDAAQIEPLLPPSPVDCLVTSREQFVLGEGKFLALGSLELPAAIALLHERIHRRIGENELVELAEAAQGLPSAIVSAANYLSTRHDVSVKEFISQLIDEKSLSRRESPAPGGYDDRTGPLSSADHGSPNSLFEAKWVNGRVSAKVAAQGAIRSSTRQTFFAVSKAQHRIAILLVEDLQRSNCHRKIIEDINRYAHEISQETADEEFISVDSTFRTIVAFCDRDNEAIPDYCLDRFKTFRRNHQALRGASDVWKAFNRCAQEARVDYAVGEANARKAEELIREPPAEEVIDDDTRDLISEVAEEPKHSDPLEDKRRTFTLVGLIKAVWKALSSAPALAKNTAAAEEVARRLGGWLDGIWPGNIQ